MNINKNSWHYKLATKEYGYVVPNLCPYVRRVLWELLCIFGAWAFRVWAGVTALGVGCLMLVSLFIPLPLGLALLACIAWAILGAVLSDVFGGSEVSWNTRYSLPTLRVKTKGKVKNT